MSNLASYLRAAQLTQGAFASLLGVSQPTVNRWIKGQSRPTWDKAAEIEKATQGAVPVSAWTDHTVSPSGSSGSEVSCPQQNVGVAHGDCKGSDQ